MTSLTPTNPPGGPPSWFAIHMALNPAADRDREWARLNSPSRDDYARDDISSAIIIETLERLAEERQRRSNPTNDNTERKNGE
jgi:hypothetical protein